MGTGVALGFIAKSKADHAECDGADVCTAAGVAQRAEAVRLGNAGTVVFVSSAVVGVAGAILLLVAPRSPAAGPERVEWGIGPGSVHVTARF